MIRWEFNQLLRRRQDQGMEIKCKWNSPSNFILGKNCALCKAIVRGMNKWSWTVQLMGIGWGSHDELVPKWPWIQWHVCICTVFKLCHAQKAVYSPFVFLTLMNLSIRVKKIGWAMLSPGSTRGTKMGLRVMLSKCSHYLISYVEPTFFLALINDLHSMSADIFY